MSEEINGGDIKGHVTRRSIWVRLIYMIVMGIAYGVAEAVAFAVVVFQFLASLFTGNPNDRMIRFGRNLARYFQQITLFMTFATEERPFPFGPWPDEPHEEALTGAEAGQPDAKPEKEADETGNDEEAKPKARSSRKSSAKPKTRTNKKSGS